MVGLISDEGRPVLSDPGFPLVRAARQRGIVVKPIPGPFAAALALAASGLPPIPFAFFDSFLIAREERRDFYRRLAGMEMTTVVYESPERILAPLADARLAFGDVDVTVAREMTKLHEEILSGTVSEVIDSLAPRDAIRGEITIVIAERAAAERHEVDPAVIAEEFQRLRDSGMRRTDATKLLAERYGLKKSEPSTGCWWNERGRAAATFSAAAARGRREVSARSARLYLHCATCACASPTAASSCPAKLEDRRGEPLRRDAWVGIAFEKPVGHLVHARCDRGDLREIRGSRRSP